MTEETILLFQKGDERAFNEVFTIYYERICSFSRKLTGSNEEGEDITIDTFRKLWERKHNFNALINIQAFLYITARNACLNFLTKKKLPTANEEYTTNVVDFEKNAMEKLIEAEVYRGIDEEVQKLPKLARQVFLLRYIKGMTVPEVAAELRISRNSVSVHSNKALNILRAGPLSRKLQLLLILAMWLIHSVKKIF